MTKNRLGDLGSSLGEHLREQRQSAKLSLRQLSELAGVSNPYLSQIERGLKRPSAEILQQLAKALEVSAESLYVRAGILEDREPVQGLVADVRHAVTSDARLTERQKAALLDIYESFVGTAPTSNGHGGATSAAVVAEAIAGTPTPDGTPAGRSTSARSPEPAGTSPRAAKGRTAKAPTTTTQTIKTQKASTAKARTTKAGTPKPARGTRRTTTTSTRTTPSTTAAGSPAAPTDHR